MSYADMIRQAAAKYGVDPDVALRVAKSEGGIDQYIQSRVKKNGVQEPSFGPFQLLVGGKGTGFPEGMGNQMIRETGLDPRNPANAGAAIDFAMKQASQKGWGQWYGAKAVGIGNYDGIGGRPATRGVSIASRAAAQPAVTVASGAPAPALPAAVNVATPGAGMMSEGTPVADINKFPEAPVMSAWDNLKNGDLKGAVTAAGKNSNVMGGLAALAGAMGGGNNAAAQEAATITPSSVGADVASNNMQLNQGAQQLMAQILATRKKPRGLSLMG